MLENSTEQLEKGNIEDKKRLDAQYNSENYIYFLADGRSSKCKCKRVILEVLNDKIEKFHVMPALKVLKYLMEE